MLLEAVQSAGLDRDEAQRILASDTYAREVRQEQAFYTQQGIHAVPSVVVNDRHLIQGGQPPEVFEQVLRQLAAQQPA